ncbi:BAG family molecular chaperone regulator 2-like [Apium graveolens]|uniref:BAG family molecular chaperone regulator 2-like n=1 Tax=Apium graveolens TaxID=4045 RepID=UPI003D7C0A7A
MIKLRSKRFFRSNSSKLRGADNGGSNSGKGASMPVGEIKWELRPGGMLVQKRDSSCASTDSSGDEIIVVKVSTVSQCHDVSIQSTSTFGELKMILAVITSLEPKEQRILFKGKEREDEDHLHMVGVRDKDKVLLLEDPAIKEEKKLLGLTGRVRPIGPPPAYQTITV